MPRPLAAANLPVTATHSRLVKNALNSDAAPVRRHVSSAAVAADRLRNQMQKAAGSLRTPGCVGTGQ